jgi:hypothetical protein
MNALNKVQAYIAGHVGSPVQHTATAGRVQRDSPEGQHSGLQYSICGLPATYTITYAIDDISLIGLYVLRLNGKWLGNAESMEDAQISARLHNMLFGGRTTH